jgi:hypothetical protein
VLRPIYNELAELELQFSWEPIEFTYDGMKFLLNQYGKTRKEIAYDIVNFICPYPVASDWAGVGSLESGISEYLAANPPEFYGYYSDYDHVALSWLFGRMIDLPNGFPMYTRDLK